MPKFFLGDKGTTTFNGRDGSFTFEVIDIRPINGRTKLVVLLTDKITGYQHVSEWCADGSSQYSKHMSLRVTEECDRHWSEFLLERRRRLETALDEAGEICVPR